LAGDETIAGSATADGLQDSSLQESSLQDAMPDHPDYHGRGWKPNKAAGTAAEAANVDKQLEQQQRSSSKEDNNSSGSSSRDGQEAGTDMPETVTLTAAGGSGKQGASAISALLSDAAAAATGQGYITSPGTSNDNGPTGCAACNIWGSGSSSAAAAAGGSSGQLLTVRSTTTTAITPAAAAAAAAVPARIRPVPPAKPLAPVRSRAAPVAVSFTQLFTPHLPAREQREVELKDIKRHAKVSFFMRWGNCSCVQWCCEQNASSNMPR
jgi:dyslexia susceptibility 1 candidate gene 1 protein